MAGFTIKKKKIVGVGHYPNLGVIVLVLLQHLNFGLLT